MESLKAVRFVKVLMGGALAALLVVGIGKRRAEARAKVEVVGIEVEGAPSGIDARKGTFTIQHPTDVDAPDGVRAAPPFRIVTTARTKFEPRVGPDVHRAAFFRELKETDKVEVKGYLNGQTVTAYKIEIED